MKCNHFDVACFRSFKQAFWTYRNIWSMTNPIGKYNEDLAQWISLSLRKVLTKENIKANFKVCGIWPLDSEAMSQKMESSRAFKPMEVEVKEIVGAILEEGGLFDANSIHYYIEHEESEGDLEEGGVAKGASKFIQLIQFLQVP